jgi:hypothetical protein
MKDQLTAKPPKSHEKKTTNLLIVHLDLIFLVSWRLGGSICLIRNSAAIACAVNPSPRASSAATAPSFAAASRETRITLERFWKS